MTVLEMCNVFILQFNFVLCIFFPIAFIKVLIRLCMSIWLAISNRLQFDFVLCNWFLVQTVDYTKAVDNIWLAISNTC